MSFGIGQKAVVMYPTPCCGSNQYAGQVVTIIGPQYLLDRDWVCNYCNARLDGKFGIDVKGPDREGGMLLSRLMPLPPDDEMKKLYPDVHVLQHLRKNGERVPSYWETA